MTATISAKRIGCQTEQVIFVKTNNVMFDDDEGIEKSLTYF